MYALGRRIEYYDIADDPRESRAGPAGTTTTYPRSSWVSSTAARFR